MNKKSKKTSTLTKKVKSNVTKLSKKKKNPETKIFTHISFFTLI